MAKGLSLCPVIKISGRVSPLKSSTRINVVPAVIVVPINSGGSKLVPVLLASNIVSSDGGLLKENEYQTSNSASRILSFSMQAKLISVGEGVLTTIHYSDPNEEVCMTEIIFAGIGGEQLTNNIPECIDLN